MIKVIFAPGCYGSFLTKCLYYLTDLTGLSKKVDFTFDESGSSHDLRQVSDIKKYIMHGHPSINGGGTISFDDRDTIISIVPCAGNRLDYYDNQFHKQEKKQIVSYLCSNFSLDIIHKTLLEGWQYDGGLDQATPKWILREWCSFWLDDCLLNGYDQSFFSDLPAIAHITTQDLFTNLATTLHSIAQAIGVNIQSDDHEIMMIQEKFVNAQELHGIQGRCDQWVDDILVGRVTKSPCITLFDEAWTQYQLRCLGYEIKCHNLDDWPVDSQTMRDLIYKTS